MIYGRLRKHQFKRTPTNKFAIFSHLKLPFKIEQIIVSWEGY